MGDEIALYLSYLQNDKNAATNTVKSYQRDLQHFMGYLEDNQIFDLSRVNHTCLNSYLLSLEREGKASSSISRMLASLKSFFRYEFKRGKISENPSEMIHGPKVEKKESVVLTEEEIERLLESPAGNSPKEKRDRAIMELMYDTGIRVSELVNLRMDDINRSVGYICVHGNGKEKALPYSKETGNLLKEYISESRPRLLKDRESDRLFVNCSGSPMSRQGLWKIIKQYGERAKIKGNISPYSLKHSSDANMRSERNRVRKSKHN